MNRQHLIAIGVLSAVFAVGAARMAAADDSQFSLAVRRSHALGSSAGMLRITPTGLQYETTNGAEARNWTYQDIKQIHISSPQRIAVLTYEDQGWIKLGADRRFEFEVRDGSVGAELVDYLMAHTDRSIVTAVLPSISKPPMYRVPVKHARLGRGSDGVLTMYDDALVYGTERAAETRYWRYKDLFAVLPLGHDRLQILAYEGGAGELRPFTFELKSMMSQDFVDALWMKVNPALPIATPEANQGRVSGNSSVEP